jgi:hypothetical protein
MMSVYSTVFAFPAPSMPPTATHIRQLVSGLLEHNFVRPPWGIVQGRLNPESPESVGMSVWAWREGHAELDGTTVVATGDDWAELGSAIDELAVGPQNMALWFADLSWSNPALADSSLVSTRITEPTTQHSLRLSRAYGRVGDSLYRRVEVAIFALSAPQTLAGEDYAAHLPGYRAWQRTGQYYLALEGKELLDLRSSPLYPVLHRHWHGSIDVCRQLS